MIKYAIIILTAISLTSYKNISEESKQEQSVKFKVEYHEELVSFIKLCKSLDIRATFIVGPYNERFITQFDPNSVADYESTTQNIKQL